MCIRDSGYSKLIIRFSQGKTEDEVRGVEVEHAVIEDGVNATCIVLVPYGSCLLYTSSAIVSLSSSTSTKENGFRIVSLSNFPSFFMLQSSEDKIRSTFS